MTLKEKLALFEMADADAVATDSHKAITKEKTPAELREIIRSIYPLAEMSGVEGDHPVLVNAHKAMKEKTSPQPHIDWFQAFMDVRSHLLVLSKAVIEGNQSAAAQFALQSQGIMERAVEIKGRGW